MEKIIFYKLQSPYSEDETKGCNLTTTDIDSNFLSLKDYDISASTFDENTYILHITRNNGEELNVDLSNIKEEIAKEVSAACHCSGSTVESAHLALNLTSDGVLSLSWDNGSGRSETSVSGLVVSAQTIYSDGTTVYGNGTKGNALRLANTEKTSAYKLVLGIKDSLPTNPNNGDRYITKETGSSKWGVLYSKKGIERINNQLQKEHSLWRIPTKEDWETLLEDVDICNLNGKILKSANYWTNSTNADSYGFGVLPAGYANSDKELVGYGTYAGFWTNTVNEDGQNYLYTFTEDDKASLSVAEDNCMYSLRLVMDYNESITGFDATIFGKQYDIFVKSGINQIWTATNLDEILAGEDYNKKFAYDQTLTGDTYYINHWNGKYWEKKELENGDTVVIQDTSTHYTQYKVLIVDGNTKLLKSLEVEPYKVIYDAGEY